MSTPERRLSFGAVAEQYDRVRPGYPEALIDHIVDVAGLAAGDEVLEVGGGTGKLTRRLLARELRVTVIEPDAEMAAVNRARAAGAALELCGFEDWPLERGRFAAVAAGQSWHWVDPMTGPSKAADALRPGGWLILAWNEPSLDDEAWHDDLQPIYARIVPGSEHSQRATFASSIERLARQLDRSERFGPCVMREVPWVEQYSIDEYVALLDTHSDKRVLPDAQRAELLAGLRASLERSGEPIEHPYVAQMVAAQVRD